MQDSKIEWTDHTFNPWIGCSKVSPGCDNCYAAEMNDRWKWVEWGKPGQIGTRKLTSDSNWNKPGYWNRFAERRGTPSKVFCASLADIFDNQNIDVTERGRERLWNTIYTTPWLEWQLLTKRPQNIGKYLPDRILHRPNVWIGTTCENQEEYNRRWPHVESLDVAVKFISYEPAVGPLFLDPSSLPDWIIAGGESGPNARSCDPDWIRALVEQCVHHRVPIFLKQWGSYASNPLVAEYGLTRRQAMDLDPPIHGKGGALLHNRLYRDFPDTPTLKRLRSHGLFEALRT